MSVDYRRISFILLGIAGLLLLLKVVTTVVFSWSDYFPPNFDADFLVGREHYFFGTYQWAFYAHVTSGPCALLLGTILISGRIRDRIPKLHRVLGRIQVANVLLIVSPSGLWMAFYADGGLIAEIAFATLAIATAVCIVCGWNAAVRRKFDRHRTWMGRCFALLCSAIVLRIIGGFAEQIGFEASWVYPMSAWACWLIPLVIFEIFDKAMFRGEGNVRQLIQD